LDKKPALCFAALFLAIFLFNSLKMQSDTLTLRYFPTVIKDKEPLVIAVDLKNDESVSRNYAVRIFIDGSLVSSTEAEIDAFAVQRFTYTRAAPEAGKALRIYVEAVNLENGEKHSDFLLVPQSPPEVWVSFSAFSSFATSLTSTSTSTSLMSNTITYYLNVMGMSTQDTGIQPTINNGLIISIVLIALLVFMELTDPAYGNIRKKILSLRQRYGTLSASLLLIFFGIVLTKVVMIIAG